MTIELTKANIVDPELLVHPDLRDFGSEPDVDFEKIKISIGEQPIVKNLKELYELRNQPLPPDFAIFKSYDIWLITHSIGILQFGGFKKLRQVQYQMEFLGFAGEKPAVTIIDLLPQTKFKNVVGGKLQIDAGILLNGQVGVPPKVSKALSATEFIGLDGKVSVNVEGDAVCNVSFSVITSEIMTIGIGNNASSWVFDRTDSNPLLGDQLMLQTVLTPNGFGRLPFKARVIATAAGPFGLLPIRMESDWVNLQCYLAQTINP